MYPKFYKDFQPAFLLNEGWSRGKFFIADDHTFNQYLHSMCVFRFEVNHKYHIEHYTTCWGAILTYVRTLSYLLRLQSVESKVFLLLCIRFDIDFWIIITFKGLPLPKLVIKYYGSFPVHSRPAPTVTRVFKCFILITPSHILLLSRPLAIKGVSNIRW